MPAASVIDWTVRAKCQDYRLLHRLVKKLATKLLYIQETLAWSLLKDVRPPMVRPRSHCKQRYRYTCPLHVSAVSLVYIVLSRPSSLNTLTAKATYIAVRMQSIPFVSVKRASCHALLRDTSTSLLFRFHPVVRRLHLKLILNSRLAQALPASYALKN